MKTAELLDTRLNNLNTQTTSDWRMVVKSYAKPNVWKSSWQLANTLIPLVVLWYLAYKAFEVSYALTLAISLLNVPFFVRSFIIMHDCGHGNFFASRKARTFWGYVTGILCFTPYWQWAKDHATHHSTSGNLDKRGFGDIWTVTVEEFSQMTRLERLRYRLYRFPFVTFVVGPFWLFQMRFRFFAKHDGPKERGSVVITNIALALLITALCYAVGWKAFLMIQLPIIIVNQVLGIWLFYVQHQYEGVYWARDKEWNYFDASIKGSSYFKLPKILQWASGNIGLHHIHHLSHLIPNYNLERCFNENPMFQNPHTITITSSFKSLSMDLYDEKNKKLISFADFYKSQETFAVHRNRKVFAGV